MMTIARFVYYSAPCINEEKMRTRIQLSVILLYVCVLKESLRVVKLCRKKTAVELLLLLYLLNVSKKEYNMKEEKNNTKKKYRVWYLLYIWRR